MIRVALDSRELKRRADFLAIASRYTRLRRAGNQYRGLCPFHRESNASLYIDSRRKIWKCYGCERGGDVFDFVMLAEHCDFSSALRILSDFVFGVAEASEARRAERLGRGEGAEGPSAREAGVIHSPNTRTAILARLDATARREAAIRAANDSAFAEFERDCEPRSGEPLLVNKRITGHE